ncbi:MAG: WxcM-like domain-containing protein [Deltaproteobacteria bacterium]|nr:WxcM-like domain-containing protein [Deltaproteobacteria bacterium]
MSNSYFSHPQALVETSQIGSGTRIWAFAHILPGATIGCDCNICDHTFIENEVVIGNGVTVKSGVQLWDGIKVEDDVFIGPNVTFTNDVFPRSRKHLEKYPQTLVRKGASIGANATVLPGITIGQNAMIGAGTVVTRSVPPNAIVSGNPGRIVGYTDSHSSSKAFAVRSKDVAKDQVLVANAKLIRSRVVEDIRGNLVAREVDNGDLPFVPQRCFLVFDVPSKEIRGEHAHKTLEQLLICIQGSLNCVLDDGKRRQEVVLDSPDVALYIPPMVWSTQYKYSSDAKLLVLASAKYDAADYIRNYDDYLNLVAS